MVNQSEGLSCDLNLEVIHQGNVYKPWKEQVIVTTYKEGRLCINSETFN